MKRNILSILLCLTLIIGSIVPCFTVANAASWNGGRTVPSYSGGMYQIATAENLAWFAYSVNNGSTTIKGKLTADIQLNYSNSTYYAWTPIGTETYPFKGLLDGDGHTVSGMYINSTSDYQGLFGKIALAAPTVPDDDTTDYKVDVDTIMHNSATVVKNLSVINSSVNGNQNVGGIAGYCAEGTIEHCSYSGTVTGQANSVGGIVGWAASDCVVTECNTSGTVTGKQRVGSVAGFANGNAVITKSYSDADVSGTQNVGGITGTLSAANFEGCFFIGSVTATDRAGGLVGYSAFGNMKSSYAVAPVTSEGTSIGGAVGTYYGGEYTGIYYSYETSGVDGVIGVGRTVEEMKKSDFVKEVNSAKIFFCYDYTNINDEYPVLTWMLQKDVWLGELTVPQKNSYGTYVISKPSELAWFSALVNGKLSGYEANPAANATVTDNLLFNIDAFSDNFDRIEWSPIGTEAHPYTGTFNGGGYNIAGLYTSTSVNGGTNVGLFGYVGTGKISDTVVIDGNINGITNVGGIAGYLVGGTITMSYFNGIVSGDKAVGGIAGFISSNTSQVTTCCALGTVAGTKISGASYAQNIGGIAGYNNRATINKCFSFAKINAPYSRYVGGILGNNAAGTLTNSYNTASSIIGGATIGGIVGYNNNGTVKSCYTSGKVSGNSQCGIAFGTITGANVSYCSYDSSYITITNTVTGANARTPSQMTGSSSIYNTGFYSSYEFRATADDTYFYYYPQISSMYYSWVKPIERASVDSVRRVQEKYHARVQLDGRTDTYYETLEEAFDYASSMESTILPMVFVVRDTVIDETIEIDGELGFFGTDSVVISRAADLTDSMIRVNGGTVTIGSSTYGTDANDSFFVDGNECIGTASGIEVCEDSVLNIEKGVNFSGFRTIDNASEPVAGAVIKNSGTLNISGGEFTDNIGKSAGGVIYNYEGTVNISDGCFHYNEAKQGGVVYNLNGHTEITGGTFENNDGGTYGGCVATNGIYAETYAGGNMVAEYNVAENGGVFSANTYSKLEIFGGSFMFNQGYAAGGAAYVTGNSELIVSGGQIKKNLAQKSSSSTQDGLGSGIYNGATLILKGDAQIHSSNDVYIASGKKLTISDKLYCSGLAATVTPSSYTENLRLLDGTAMRANYQKITLSNSAWHILATGSITSVTSQTVAVVSKTDAYSVEYVSIFDAFDSVSADEEAVITLVGDVQINSVLPVKGEITFLCDDITYTVSRAPSFKGYLFDISSGGTLNLGETVLTPSQQSQLNFINEADNDGMIVINGGGNSGSCAINVQSGGTLNLYDDVAIQNCVNTTYGTVSVAGTMNMYGGAIRNNTSAYGGAIYVKSTGSLFLCGGIINANTSSHLGNAVYALGNVTKRTQAYDYMYVENVYDSETGEVIAAKNPVYKCTAKTEIQIPDLSDIYLSKNKINIDDKQSDFYIRSLNYLPQGTQLNRTELMLELAKYTEGITVVSGEDIENQYEYFSFATDGYYLKSDGTLGMNKLVVKDGTGLAADRENGLLLGINLAYATAAQLTLYFANNRANVKFYDVNGALLADNGKVSTGCTVKLNDTDGTVLDELTVSVSGDVNGDGAIDGLDSVVIRAIVGNMYQPEQVSSAVLKAADFNSDNSITFDDSILSDLHGLAMRNDYSEG